MSINRNDPCPCGSGLKYKKCCLKQQNIVKLHEVKEKKFFDLKNSLSQKMINFISSQFTFTEMKKIDQSLQAYMKQISPKHLNLYTNVWRSFFYQFPNGLRGVDWFYQEGKNLQPEEKDLLKTWTQIKPHLLQVVDQNEDGYWFADLITYERFFFLRNEVLTALFPWTIVMTLIEPYNEGFCIHGVAGYHHPTVATAVVQKVREIMEQTGLTYSEVMSQFYPQIYQFLLDAEYKESNDPNNSSKTTLTYSTLYYDVVDQERLLNFLVQQPDFVFDQWNNDKKVMSWTSSWLRYTDNQSTGPIYLGKVLGNIEVTGTKLTFSTIDSESITKFKEITRNLYDVIRYVKTEEQQISSPRKIHVFSTCLQMGKGVPKFFSLFAQTEITMMNIDEPFLILDNKSPLELVKTGEKSLVDEWLKGLEFDSNQLVRSEYNIDLTCNFNSMRNKLGLPLSPFVSGKETRITLLEPCYNPMLAPSKLAKEDIPTYELLGFTPDTVRDFYAKDVIQFYKATTQNSSQTTKRKYALALQEFVFLMSRLDENERLSTPITWFDCDLAFWRYFFFDFYKELGVDLGVTERKNLHSVMKKFTKWIDDRYPTHVHEKYALSIENNLSLPI